MGWNPPPHPFEIVPPYVTGLGDGDSRTYFTGEWEDTATGSYQINAVYALLDYVHDDNLINWMSADNQTQYYMNAFGSGTGTGGTFNKLLADRGLLVHFYLHPEDWYPGGPKNWSLDASVMQTEGWGPAWSEQDVTNRWSDLDKALQGVVASRQTMGPLPTNDYAQTDSSTVVVYYYDTDTLKKQTYPTSQLGFTGGQANDPTNLRWWAVSGATTQDFDPGSQAWKDEGYDWNKDVGPGTIDTIVQIVAAAIAAVLTITGVGAALAPLVVLVGQLVVDAINLAYSIINNGDELGAVTAFGDTFLKMAGANLTSISPKITGPLISAAGAALKMLAKDLDPQINPSSADLSQAIQNVQANINSYTQADEFVTLTLIKQILSGTNVSVAAPADDPNGLIVGGPPVSWDTFYAGYRFAEFANADQIKAVSGLMGPTWTGAAQALWSMGSRVSVMILAQKQPGFTPAVTPPWAVASLQAIQVRYVQPTANADLMSYVRNFLAPRYNIPT